MASQFCRSPSARAGVTAKLAQNVVAIITPSLRMSAPPRSLLGQAPIHCQRIVPAQAEYLRWKVEDNGAADWRGKAGLSRRRSKHEDCVQAPEGEGIGHGVIDLALAPHIRGVVEVAFGIDLVEADRGRHEFLLDGLDRGNRLDAAAGAEAMAMHGFG